MANRLASFSAAITLLSAVPSAAPAAMELYFSDPTGDPHQVQILPGESLDVEVGFAISEPSFGFDYILGVSDNGSGLFSLTNRLIPADCPFSWLATSNATLLQPDSALLDPLNNRTLGATKDSVDSPQPPGLYVVGILTITSSSDVPAGTYVLSFAVSNGINSAMQDTPITTHDYVIVVTDSPSGNDTGDAPADSDVDTDDTDESANGGTDNMNDLNSGGNGTTNGSGTGTSETTLPPVTVGARCGAGFGGLATAAAMLTMLLMRAPGRRA